MTDLVDAEARRLIATALDQNMVVEAAAGTGKTTELVRRIIAVLADGRTSVDRLVAVTFTEKAAGELKLRLRAGLEKARAAASDAGRRRALEHALAHLEEAHVSTIHGFCTDLLRERPVEARVDPRFAVLTEPQAERLYRQAFDLWLQERLEDPPEGVRRSLRRESRGRSQESAIVRLRRAGWTLCEWRDFRAPWRRDPFFDRAARITALVQALEEFSELRKKCRNPHDNLFLDTLPASQTADHIAMAESVRARDLDGVEATLIKLRSWRFAKPRKGYGAGYGQGVSREEVQVAHQRLVAELERFERDADADLAALLHGELLETIDRYETLKQSLGQLDFVDLLLRARDLVRDNEGVRAHLQRRFTHLFVDEFQDTDPLQAEILLLLASRDPHSRDWREISPAPGKLFVVGDPKQAIYRFRRADVGVYQAVKQQLVAGGALCRELTTSFRSLPSIQRFVNAAFAPLMREDLNTLQAGYVPLSAHRQDIAGQPQVIALPVPSPYNAWGKITGMAIEQSLPDAVGAFVDWLLNESGWTVTERERADQRVPVAASHVCLLFRRFDNFRTDMTRPYVQALEARGIPHLLVGGKSFHAREEVETMRAALTAIEWPDDELSLFATLHGSLFAIDDEELLLYRHRYRRLHPFRIAADVPAELHSIVDALELIQSLHKNRNWRPVAETIDALLEATRAPASFALRPSGEQALANVLHIADLARAYEAQGGLSFRGFVQGLIDEAEEGEAPEAPVLEEGSDGVRIMTAHKAKGLEFPVVILADISARLNREDASRYIDAARSLCAVRIGGWSPIELREQEEGEVARDGAEGVRIAYVAATRARDLLVVPALGDQPFESGWVGPLNAALYPADGRRRASIPAPGCPAFGGDSVRVRPAELDGVVNVRPGAHTFDPHDYTVVWWDPTKLALGKKPSFGLRQEELLSRDVDPSVVERGLASHRDWLARRDRAVADGAVPRYVVQTATERALQGGPETVAVEVVELARAGGRPAGPRYGALVHAVLAVVPLDADQARTREMAVLQGRILGATAPEIDAACASVGAALAHPLLARARSAPELKRETPVTLRTDDGTLVEGVIDLAFPADDGWLLIDFKTDRELAKGLEIYRRQVALYAHAIATATAMKVRAVLMRV